LRPGRDADPSHPSAEV